MGEIYESIYEVQGRSRGRHDIERKTNQSQVIKMKKLLILSALLISLATSAQVDTKAEQNLLFFSIGQTNYYPKSLQRALKSQRQGLIYHWRMKQVHYTFSMEWYSKAYAYHLYSMNKYAAEYLHYATAHDSFIKAHGRAAFGLK